MVPAAQHSSPVVAGKMSFRNTRRPQAQHDPDLRATIVSAARPCPAASWRSGRDDRGKSSEKRAGGSAPPKTVLACTSGPFGEVAPRIFPCRKAGRPQGAGEASAEGVWTLMRRSPGSRSASGSRDAPSPVSVSRSAPSCVAPGSCARFQGPSAGRRPPRVIPSCRPEWPTGCTPAPSCPRLQRRASALPSPAH